MLILDSIDQKDKNVNLKKIEEHVTNQFLDDTLKHTSHNVAEANVIGLANVTTKPKTVIFQSELELEDAMDNVVSEVQDISLEPFKLIVSKDHAATVIQARARGFVQRKRYLILLHHHKSAIKIQSYWWASLIH